MENNGLHKLSRSDLINTINFQREEKEYLIKDKNKLLSEKQNLKSKYEAIIQLLVEQLNLLRYNLFGSKSEKLSEKPEDRKFDEVVEPDNEEEIIVSDESIWVKGYQHHKNGNNNKTGRKKLPALLPRVTITHDINNSDKVCPCGCDLQELKPSTYEQLELIPAKVYVTEHIKKNYGCPKCSDTIKSATMPKQPIPKSIASPSLLSHILISKYQDHLPLYRQELILQRFGVNIARNTLSSWVIKISLLLKPLYGLLKLNINNYDVAFTDETILQVLKEPDKKAQSKSYMWVFAGGDPKKFTYVYEYSASRSSKTPIEFFNTLPA